MAHYGYRVYAEAQRARTTRYHAFGSAEEPVRKSYGSIDGSRRARVDHRALDILGAEAHWSKDEIHKRYRMLVKTLHPDLNGGNRYTEGQFRDVIWAWKRIKESHGFAD